MLKTLNAFDEKEIQICVFMYFVCVCLHGFVCTTCTCTQMPGILVGVPGIRVARGCEPTHVHKSSLTQSGEDSRPNKDIFTKGKEKIKILKT